LVCLKPVLPLPLGFLRQPDCFSNFQLGLVVADLEIDSKKYIAGDSDLEIESNNCALPIQKSTVKTTSLPIQKPASAVGLFRTLFFCCLHSSFLT